MKKTQLFIVIFMMITSLISQVSTFPFNEGFEGTQFPPSGWNLIDGNADGYNWAKVQAPTYPANSGSGSAMSENYSMFGGILNPNNYLVTPAISLPENTTINLRWYAKKQSIPSQHYSIVISTDSNSIGDFTTTLFSETIGSDNYQQRNTDLSAYAGQTIYIAFRHHDSTELPPMGQSGLQIDDISIFLVLDSALQAESISGATLGAVGDELTYLVTVSNVGTNPVSDYFVYLMMMDGEEEVELAGISGATIQPGTSEIFDFVFTPVASGSYRLFGMVEFNDGEETKRDRTLPLNLLIVPEGIDLIFVGDPDSDYSLQGPFQFNQQGHMTQSIYNESYFNNKTGVITNITYSFSAQGDIPANGPHLRVFMGTTDLDNFGDFEPDPNGPWIEYSNFTQVFGGQINLSTPGPQDVNIILDQPFEYNGGNLVIMTTKGLADWEQAYNGVNVWQTTDVPGLPVTISYGGWQAANPVSPSAHFTSPNWYLPNTVFHLITAETGSLTGTVTANGLPLEDVLIEFIGTPIYTYTNVQGKYEIGNIPQGFISIRASKNMYNEVIINNISIVSGEETIQNIEMTIIDYDFKALSLTGPTMPSVNQDYKYIVTVRNDGGVPAEGYEVRLMSGQNILASVMGETLLPTETATITLIWQPQIETTFQIYGQVIYELCPNIENHSTNSLNVHVQPYGTAFAYIGDPNSTLLENHPIVAVNLPTSISQVIYLENELAIEGAITQITYYYTGNGTVPEPVKIFAYATITDLDKHDYNSGYPYLSNDWISMEQYTLIYEGYIDVTGVEEREIILDLPEPFYYSEGNLAVFIHAPLDYARWYSGFWKQTPFPDKNKAIRDVSLAPFNFNELGPGFVTQFAPNTLFSFMTANMGSLSGKITHNDNSIIGATVTIASSETNMSERVRITDNNGNYSFSYIPIGNIDITVSMHGYLDRTIQNVVINDEEITIENITLLPKPQVDITGSVFASDTGYPLPNATIVLKGYDSYENIYTNESGYYTIPNVYTNEIYTLTVQANGYVTHTQTVNLGSTDLTIPLILLQLRALRPRNVVAQASSNSVSLYWEHPSESSIMISQNVNDKIYDGIGDGIDAVFSIAHRFTSEQLFDIGVVNGNITTIGLIPGELNATYAPRIWTAGSINPLNSGNLIYEGDPVHGSNLNLFFWNDIELFAPLAVPSTGELWIGFEVRSNLLPIAIDEGPPVNNYANLVYSRGSWSTLLDFNIPHNILIRAMIENAEGRNITNIPDSYIIHRANVETIDNPDTWQYLTELDTENHETIYLDETWAQAPDGEYRYVVQSVYDAINISNPAFSNNVHINMLAEVIINVYTSTGASVSGAEVTLTNQNQNPNHVYQQNATHSRVVFNNVWKGSYTLTIGLTGFQRVFVYDIDIRNNNLSFNVTLNESQSILYESFENYLFPPDGWMLYDADGDMNNWLLIHERPDLAHTGNYFIASHSRWHENETLYPDNYIITKPIEIPEDKDVNLQYYVTTSQELLPIETYSVMISFSENIAEFFPVFSETLNETNLNWQQRNIDLSFFAGQTVYIAWRHHLSYANEAVALDTVNITVGDKHSFVDFVDVTIVPNINQLNQNYPNPFNPNTYIAFDLTKESLVEIDIFNIRGQKVKTLVDDFFTAGHHVIQWNGTDDNGRNLASGVYFYKMKSDDFTQTRRMVLMK